jgi:flagellar biosynthesis/type III secretory pathway ATPase
VGKSVLLGMMARYTAADVTVVGLIGERGREVKEFIEDILGREGLKRAVVVAAPADCSPVLRMQGAVYATAIAEHFRDQGLNVLLLMDSLTGRPVAARSPRSIRCSPKAMTSKTRSLTRPAQFWTAIWCWTVRWPRKVTIRPLISSSPFHA